MFLVLCLSFKIWSWRGHSIQVPLFQPSTSSSPGLVKLVNEPLHCSAAPYSEKDWCIL